MPKKIKINRSVEASQRTPSKSLRGSRVKVLENELDSERFRAVKAAIDKIELPHNDDLFINAMKQENIEAIIKLFQNGGHRVEAMVILGISDTGLYQWLTSPNEKYRLLQYIFRMGEMQSYAWWLRHGKNNLENKEFNATLYCAHMNNRFGWGRAQELPTPLPSPALEQETVEDTTVISEQHRAEVEKEFNLNDILDTLNKTETPA